MTATVVRGRMRATPRARRAADELGVDLSTFGEGDEPVRLADVVVAAERNKRAEGPTPGTETGGPSPSRVPPGFSVLVVDCGAWWEADVDLAATVRGMVDAALAEHPLLDARQVRVVPMYDQGDAIGLLALPPLAPGDVIALGHSDVAPRVAAVTLPDGSYAVRVRPQALLGLVWDQAAVGPAEPIASARRVQQLMVLGPGRQD